MIHVFPICKIYTNPWFLNIYHRKSLKSTISPFKSGIDLDEAPQEQLLKYNYLSVVPLDLLKYKAKETIYMLSFHTY